MDEIIDVNIPWETELIPDSDTIYRRIHFTVRQRKRREPTESAFGLRPDEKYLSFNWGKYINVPETFISIGLNHNVKKNWVNIRDFTLLHFNVGFIKTMPDVASVLHKPSYYGNPSPVGLPNNRSHAGVYFDDDDDSKFRSTIAKWAQDNLSGCDCEFEHSNIDDELNELRERGNETKYHKA
jgi:hypothetical protein